MAVTSARKPGAGWAFQRAELAELLGLPTITPDLLSANIACTAAQADPKRSVAAADATEEALWAAYVAASERSKETLEFMAVPLWATMRSRTQLGHMHG